MLDSDVPFGPLSPTNDCTDLTGAILQQGPRCAIIVAWKRQCRPFQRHSRGRPLRTKHHGERNSAHQDETLDRSSDFAAHLLFLDTGAHLLFFDPPLDCAGSGKGGRAPSGDPPRVCNGREPQCGHICNCIRLSWRPNTRYPEGVTGRPFVLRR